MAISQYVYFSILVELKNVIRVRPSAVPHLAKYAQSLLNCFDESEAKLYQSFIFTHYIFLYTV